MTSFQHCRKVVMGSLGPTEAKQPAQQHDDVDGDSVESRHE